MSETCDERKKRVFAALQSIRFGVFDGELSSNPSCVFCEGRYKDGEGHKPDCLTTLVEAWTLNRHVKDDWQPIETIPKDGTRVLLTDGELFTAGYSTYRDEPEMTSRLVIVDGIQQVSIVGGKIEMIPNPDYPRRTYYWVTDGVTAFSGDTELWADRENLRSFVPSHWMTLPSPPTEALANRDWQESIREQHWQYLREFNKPSFIPVSREPKHEPFLIVESANGQWECSGCGSWYTRVSMDEDELEHCPKCCGTKIKCPVYDSLAHENKPPLSESEKAWMWNTLCGSNRVPMPPDFPANAEVKFHCDECEDEREHYHNHTAIGTLLMLNDVPTTNLPSDADLRKTLKSELNRRAMALGYPIDPHTGFATSGMGADYRLVAEELKKVSVWVCANHPPGSEVEVKKGEACYCGNREN
jgi:hypothetical protein